MASVYIRGKNVFISAYVDITQCGGDSVATTKALCGAYPKKDKKRIRFKTGYQIQDLEYVKSNVDELLKSHIKVLQAPGGDIQEIGYRYISMIKKQNGLRKESAQNYIGYINTFASIIKKDLKAVTSEDMEYFIERNRSKNRIYQKLLYSFINRFLNNCVEKSIISTNPFKIPKKIVGKEPKKKIPFTRDEISLLLSKCDDEQFKTMLTLLFYTGMRPGEMMALSWEDIDLEHKSISINKSVHRDNTIGLPKNSSSIRDIEMLDIVYTSLSSYKASSDGVGLVFFDNDRKMYQRASKSINERWSALLKKCNLPNRKIYTTRHSFASLMLSHNEALPWVSSMLGHSQSSTTLNTYTHYVKDPSIKRASFLDDKYSSPSEEIKALKEIILAQNEEIKTLKKTYESYVGANGKTKIQQGVTA